MRGVLILVASLAVSTAVPATAATYGHTGHRYASSGTVGADFQCRSFRNYNQREACMAEVGAGMPYHPGEGGDPLGFLGGLISGGDAEQQHNSALTHG